MKLFCVCLLLAVGAVAQRSHRPDNGGWYPACIDDNVGGTVIPSCPGYDQKCCACTTASGERGTFCSTIDEATGLACPVQPLCPSKPSSVPIVFAVPQRSDNGRRMLQDLVIQQDSSAPAPAAGTACNSDGCLKNMSKKWCFICPWL